MSAALIIVGAALTAQAVYALTVMRCDTGIVLCAGIGLLLALAGLFYDALYALCQNVLLCIALHLAAFAVAAFLLGFAAFLVCSAVALRQCAPADARFILVLGSAPWRSSPSLTLALRLRRACELAERFPCAALVLSGGMSQGSGVSESAHMARQLASMGISRDRIIEENESLSTYENFKNARALVGSSGGCVFVTNRFHSLRAKMLAARVGLNCTCVPAPDPMRVALVQYLREYAAILNLLILRRVN
ncbi:MAG: YdcF family protein [Clostridia bacterium]|nr:YdcF family protein [Clostridia bacterium]